MPKELSLPAPALRCTALALALTLASAAEARAPDQTPDPTGRPALLEGLLACRAITVEGERLACFDRAAAAFDIAEREGEVTVVDRAQARETRTRLFGLDLDTANLFGRLRQDDPVEAVETTLTSARQNNIGQWTFMLADGSTWRQIDTDRVTSRVVPGAAVRIRNGAVGSYLLSVNRAPSVRVHRDR